MHASKRIVFETWVESECRGGSFQKKSSKKKDFFCEGDRRNLFILFAKSTIFNSMKLV